MVLVKNNNKSLYVFVGCFFVLVMVVFLGSSYGFKKVCKDCDVDRPVPLVPLPLSHVPRADILRNPYDPPLKDDRYGIAMAPLPVNIMTNIGAVNAEYRQIGIITPAQGSSKNEILPLMGRPLFTNRQKWQYYSISNQHNNVKLPLRVKGRSGTYEYGVDELFDGDAVFVEGNKERFRVTLYDKDGIQYLG